MNYMNIYGITKSTTETLSKSKRVKDVFDRLYELTLQKMCKDSSRFDPEQHLLFLTWEETVINDNFFLDRNGKLNGDWSFIRVPDDRFRLYFSGSNPFEYDCIAMYGNNKYVECRFIYHTYESESEAELDERCGRIGRIYMDD